jgi:regulator of sigma E protease
LENLTFLWNIWYSLQVVFGIGLLIFLHELGHFLLAKWNGVKVEKFSIGFGRTLLGFTRGETEYVVAMVPLGGFVKMLGEGPEEEANKSTDPRAYPNKSVGARMAIISAGVIMNVLLGLACFVVAYGLGMTETPARIGVVKAGTPAYEAGLRPGDEILAIDGRGDLTYEHLILKVALSGPGQVLRFEVRRPGQDRPIVMNIEPKREPGADKPTIGLLQAASLTLGLAPESLPAGSSSAARSAAAALRAGDRLVALGPEGTTPEPVADAEAYNSRLARWAGQPLTFVFERPPDAAAGGEAPRAEPPGRAGRIEATLPPNPFVDFGVRLTMEPIASIQKGSPADRAGFRKGDRILKVNGQDDFDPMRLPTLCFENAGQEMTFEVQRREPGQEESRTVTITVTPDPSPAWTGPILRSEPLNVPGLGLAYHVTPHIEAVAPGSPAEKAGLKKGDTINALSFLPPADAPAKSKARGQLETFEFKEDVPDWPAAFFDLQLRPRQAVQLTVNHSNKPVTITPEPDPTWSFPLRGLVFQGLERPLPPQSVGMALKRGFNDTVDNILTAYLTIRSLVVGRLSHRLLAGPPMIARMAFNAASMGWTPLIHLLGILSINLAVLNFLPIPPLDGGQMAFLIAEKIRGRPLPDSAVIVTSWIGLLMVLALLAFAIFQDVLRMATG